MNITIEQFLQQCRNLVIDPEYRTRYLREQRGQYPGIVGYFSNYIPQEIIAAAGLYPVRIVGTLQSTATHQHPLFNPVCSFVQDVCAAAEAGEFAVFDTVVFPNSCDSLKLLHQLWGSSIKRPAAITLLHPVQADAAAVHYFTEQLKLFADEMRCRAGYDFTETQLRQAVVRYNQTRDLLRQLYDIRRANSHFLTAAQTIALVTAAMIAECGEYNRMLELLLQQAPQESPEPEKDTKKIMLVGPVMDNIRLLEQIEEAGLRIVDDELTNGSRYIGQNVRTDGDLYENLAQRYLYSAASPTMYSAPNADSRSFQQHIESLRPDGVLFVIQKFCEPHIHNYLLKAELLRQMEIPVQRLEIEHDAAGLNERQITQLESFAELAGSPSNRSRCHSESRNHANH